MYNFLLVGNLETQKEELKDSRVKLKKIYCR